MDEFWRLVVLSTSMFIGCYAAGAIPLALTLSEVSCQTTFLANHQLSCPGLSEAGERKESDLCLFALRVFCGE